MKNPSLVPEPHRARLSVAAHWLAVAVMVVLPWSTSAVSILTVIWALTLLPTVQWSEVEQTLRKPAALLPVLLVVLALVGLAWSDAPWVSEARNLQPFFKLLAIPLLIIQFARTEHARALLNAFIASSAVLLIASYAHATWPTISLPLTNPQVPGAPVVDYIVQSGFFTYSAFLLLAMAAENWRDGLRRPAILQCVLAAAFLINIAAVVTGRTSLVVVAALVIVFGARAASKRTMIIVGLAAIVLVTAAWVSAPQLRTRVMSVFDEVHRYETTGELTSSGQRITFWHISLLALKQSPVIGLGTGGNEPWFGQKVSELGLTGLASMRNPHNQILAVGLQLGLVGIAVLLAMWIAHVLVFRGSGLIAWAGLSAVIQNVVASLFNSHLFDFAPGWFYVFVIGAMAGSIFRQQATSGES